MGPQNDIVFHIKRILHIPGRMILGNIQGLKIVVIRLDFRTFHDGKPKAGKDRADFLTDLGNRVELPRFDPPPRKGDIDLFPERAIVLFR